MRNKSILLFVPIILLSASCSLFSTPVASGVIKTVNGGADWQFSNAIKNSKTANLSSLNIAKLGLDPQNRETVYAGSYTAGLYKSEDSGGTWTNILSKIGVYDFAVDPIDTKIIYVAGVYSEQGKVLKTTDGGATWQQIYNEASANNPVRVIALNPVNPNQLIIGTTSGNLVQSSDSGNTWKLAVDFSDRIQAVAWRQNSIYVLLKTKGFYVSAADATNFQELTTSLTKLSASDYLYNGPLTFSQAYVDTITASLIYITSSRGVYKSVDSGKTWTLQPLPVQQASSNARAIAVANSNSNTVYTSVDSVVYKSTDGGSTWQTQAIATAGFINYILIDPDLPQIVYGGIYVAQ